MNPDSGDLPIACNLTTKQLRRRVGTFLARIKSSEVEVEELPDGYAFHLPGTGKYLALATAWMAAERKCCPFLTFELVANPNMGPLLVRVTGPSGAKEFLKATFCEARDA